MKINEVKEFKELVEGCTIVEVEYDSDSSLFSIELDTGKLILMDISSVAVAEKYNA